MRLNEVVQITGLSKRTIHFYIEQKLIAPHVNERNGYRDFSKNDIDKLSMIKKLRSINLPLADIKSILAHPNTANFYLHRHLNKLNKDLGKLSKSIRTLDSLIDTLPFEVTNNSLKESLNIIKTEGVEDNLKQYKYFKKDARLISLYLWESFLYIPMTEYREYLWNKVLKITEKEAEKSLYEFKEYLYNLSDKEIEKEFSFHHETLSKVAALTEADYSNYAEVIIANINFFLNNNTLINQWKTVYHITIKPCTTFYDSHVADLMCEFNPKFKNYFNNIHICCSLANDFLSSSQGDNLKNKLNNTLNEYIDINSCHHGELEYLSCFVDRKKNYNEIEAP